MPCNFNYSASETADLITKKRISDIMSGRPKDVQEAAERLFWFQDNFEVKEVSAESLKRKDIPTTEGKARVYGIKGSTALQIEESFTTEAKKKFIAIKGKARAEEISKDPTNIIKQRTGTKVHLALQHAVLRLSKTKYAGRVISNSKQTPVSRAEIMNGTGFSEKVMNGIDKTAEALIEQVLEIQDGIDKKGKVAIVPESILVKDGKLAGTIDVVVVFSDLSYSTYDYKTLVPTMESKKVVGVGGVDVERRIIDPAWIAFYHYEDWNLQLPKANNVLQNVVKLKGLRQSRIIPLHTEFGYDNNKKQITEHVTQLRSFADADEFLDQVPIQEMTDNEALNAQINKMLASRANLRLELDRTAKDSDRYHYIKNRLDRVTVAINRIIVRKDVRLLMEDYQAVVKKFGKFTKHSSLIGVDVNEEGTPNYLNLSQMLDLHRELSMFTTLMDVTPDYYTKLGLTEEEEYSYIANRNALKANVGTMMSALKEEIIARLKLDAKTLHRMRNMKDVGILSRYVDTFSEIDNPFTQEAFSRISDAKAETTIKLQKFMDNLRKVSKGMEDAGFRVMSGYDQLINRETGNLYSKFSSSFLEAKEKAFKNEDAKWFLQYYKLKDNAKETFNELVESYIRNNNLDPKAKKDFEKIERFKASMSIANALTSRNKLHYYYELKDEYKNPSKDTAGVYSAEYKNIYNNKALNDFYNFWTESMKDFRFMLGFGRDYHKLPDNFIPWMRRDVVESMFQDGFMSQTLDNIRNLFYSTNTDQDFGDVYAQSKIATDTGEVLNNVPIWFINPIVDRNGEINKTLKSYDLGKVLYAMASTAYNYQNMKNIEAEMDALTFLLEQPEFGVIQKAGGRTLSVKGGSEAKLSGKESPIYDLFRKHIKYAVYGVKIQDREKSPTLVKTLLTLNRFEVATMLGFAPIVQISASIAAKINQYFEASKGYFFTKKQMAQAEADAMNANFGTREASINAALINFFEPYELTMAQRMNRPNGMKRERIGGNMLTRISAMNLPFMLFRKGSAWINTTVMFAMLRNYGLDARGNVKKLSVLPEGSKSLKDLCRIEGDNFIIDGIMNEKGEVTNIHAYAQFRNLVYSVARGIHGEMSENDQNAINLTMWGKLFMTYKNWLPFLTKERLQGFKYNKTKDVITIGKLNALWKSAISEDNKQFLGMMYSIGQRILTLSADIATFGILKNAKGFKTSEARLRQMYETFKEGNMDLDIFEDDIESVTYEQFKQYYNGQIRNAVVELRVLLTLVAAVAMLGAAFDDDDDGKAAMSRMNWAERQTFRMVNRVRRELAFFYGGGTLQMVTQNPLPITGVLVNGGKAIYNFIDESVEAVSGMDDRRDTTPYGYYTLRMLPYHRLYTDLFEPSKQDISKQR